MHRISAPPPDALTQGVIFTCALAEDYDECDVAGLIITARCDAYNDKAPIYNYVPVVKFENWIVRDGVDAVANRSLKAALGDMKSFLKGIGEATSLLDFFPPEQLYREIFVAQSIKNAPAFLKASQRYAAMRDVINLENNDRLDVLVSEKSEAKKFIRELLSNSLAEFHYLPGISPNENVVGHVALLREVRHLPRELAKSVSRGLDASEYAEVCRKDERSSGRLRIGSDTIAWPIGMLLSPDLELLMQRLTHLFARVGVADLSPSTLKMLESALPEKGAIK
ncbi:MAG: hypothetical protein Q8L66_10580 [Caulobacter sp.]|nr:hypothetical protein [Caulobacter sp.]